MFDANMFGQRLSLLRKEKGASRADIAKLLEVSVTQIGDMERGNSATTMARLWLLCEYFHVSADYFLGRSDKR